MAYASKSRSADSRNSKMNINYLERIGDILKSTEIGAILHQANIYHKMGAGFAKRISRNYPEAYAADRATKRGDFSKLGTFSKAIVKNVNSGAPLTIYNCYSQGKYGRDPNVVYTDYDAVRSVFKRVNEDYWNSDPEFNTIGILYKYGCVLGGGDWETVLDIINTTFTGNVIPIIYKLD
jgi:hypothetical protein